LEFILNVLLTPHFGYALSTDYQKHILNLSETEKHRTIKDTLLEARDEEQARRHLKQQYRRKKIYNKVDIKWIRNLQKYLFGAYTFLKFRQKERGVSFQERAKQYGQFRDEVLEFINGRFESPQFLWFHTAINHLPYLPPENSDEFNVREVNHLNYRGLSGFVNKKTCGKLKRLYVESMEVTDRLIGDIVNALRTKDLLGNSIIVITADHGEEFMEEGHFGHSEESSSDRLLHVPLMFSEESSSDRLLHVPLMFYCKSILEPKSVSVPVSTIDILPTICDLLGIAIPHSARGLSLKETLFNNAGNSIEYPDLWQRPFFSEAWKPKGLLDRDCGHESNKKIFTVRMGIHKLKVIQEQKTGNKVVEKFELVNWVSDEKLDVESNSQLVECLNRLLRDHIDNEGVFARRIKNEAEKQRIKGALGRIGNKA
jgi:hypothetical protein